MDAGLGYEGSPATNFTGADHLAGMTVTGLADGSVITPFVMPAMVSSPWLRLHLRSLLASAIPVNSRPFAIDTKTEQSKANLRSSSPLT